MTSLEILDATVCCTPTASPMTTSDAERLAATFKALGDPTRLKLLSIIASSEGQEACVCDLTEPVGLAQPTVSHHLKVLAEAGFVSRSKRGTWAYYRLAPEALQAVDEVLRDVLLPSVDR
ncbi:helix-turn-helix transcriptional regulator [uncultured Microbacterium sp.]|uniref:ArsR/SmtB family transcription factor n=1 Tax=uncultured Microbacterium sp. TaxID=191216 RepID=UPI0025FE0EF9|nr:metalloregulator ArsR/SmtB family transcription factor [uncultured Microbacterium sp.]